MVTGKSEKRFYPHSKFCQDNVKALHNADLQHATVLPLSSIRSKIIAFQPPSLDINFSITT